MVVLAVTGSTLMLCVVEDLIPTVGSKPCGKFQLSSRKMSTVEVQRTLEGLVCDKWLNQRRG